MIERSLNPSILEAQAVESFGVPHRPGLFSDFQIEAELHKKTPSRARWRIISISKIQHFLELPPYG